MKIINPGNALVFYNAREEQMKYQVSAMQNVKYGYPMPEDTLYRFQLPAPSTNVGITQARLLNEEATNTVPLDTGNFIRHQAADTGEYYDTYLGGDEITACGFFTLGITYSDGQMVYSEVIEFQKMDFASAGWFELKIASSVDTPDVIYSQGYTQTIMFVGSEDFPSGEVEQENTEGDQLVRLVEFQSQRIRRQINMLNFPQVMIGCLYSLGANLHINNVVLTNKRTGVSRKMLEPAFSARDQGDQMFLIGELSYTESKTVFSATDDRGISVVTDQF